ncbi:hypothetical protein LCGC14_2141160, partial [marine sediment metagenome]
MFTVIGIAGSPRKTGNSATLLEAVLAGAAAAGECAADVVYLNDLTYRGCQACEPCTPDATCQITDDLSPVLEAVRAADIWVLATPIYFDGVSGQMKSFFDRCCHLACDGPAGKQKKQLIGPRAGGIVFSYEDNPRDDYLDVVNRLAGYLGWMGDFGKVEVLPAAKVSPSSPVTDRPELLQQARAMGEALVESLTER